MASSEQQSIKDKPIGVFDSGVGGLTVVKEIMRQLPCENVVYFGDTARVPYGTKSSKTILRMAREDVRFLKTLDIKLIVIACNSASSAGADVLENEAEVPVLDVIRPGAEAAVRITRNKKIGIIGTSATVRSQSYQNAVKSISDDVVLFSRAAPLLVPLVEEGWLASEITRSVIVKYLGPLLEEGIDTLVLGCTHYPLLRSLIEETLNGKALIVDSASETVRHLKEKLQAVGHAREDQSPQYRFYVSDDPEKFKSLGTMFLEKDIEKVEEVHW